jgi:hypothetical protein
MPIGNTNIHKQINVSDSLINAVSFVFCEFNRVASYNEGKTII